MQTTEKTHEDIDKLTKAERWKIADWIAEDRLPRINSFVTSVKPKKSFYGKYIKRLIDIVVSFTVLIISLPINFLLFIVTVFDVGRPLFFTQKRAGKDGKVFSIFKFRSMTNKTDENGELLPPSKRVTKWGKFVRKTSLDELLNFWAILKGDMSLIGPRPLPPEYTSRYNDRHKMRLAVRPGLECPLHKRTEHLRTWQEQFENDIWYIENLSFRTDCIMILRLIQMIFDKKATKARGVVQRRAFMGYSEDGIAIALADTPEEYLIRLEKETAVSGKKGE